jgi:hypothetical protein
MSREIPLEGLGRKLRVPYIKEDSRPRIDRWKFRPDPMTAIKPNRNKPFHDLVATSGIIALLKLCQKNTYPHRR